MKTRRKKLLGCLGFFLMLVHFTACAVNNHTHQPIDSSRFIDEITPDVEALYLTWNELDQTYKDIKFLERGYLFDPDDHQLGYLQKISMHIQNANRRIHNSWDRLSLLHYIRPQWIPDYLTLANRSIASTLWEIGYDQKFITIYAAFIQKDAVREEVHRAQNQLESAVEDLNKIYQKVLPHTNTHTNHDADLRT